MIQETLLESLGTQVTPAVSLIFPAETFSPKQLRHILAVQLVIQAGVSMSDDQDVFIGCARRIEQFIDVGILGM